MEKLPGIFICGKHKIEYANHTRIAGILNVTPDSFSDGGRYSDKNTAVSRALQMLEEGADIIDVGGQSTRPGYTPVDAQEEIHRVVPVIEAIAARTDAVISIDTTKPAVADAACAAGAVIINSVGGLNGDCAGLIPVAERHGAGVIIGHIAEKQLADVELIPKLRAALLRDARAAIAAGIPAESVMLDPGIGFGKMYEQNLRLITSASLFPDFPVMIGVSRKSVIGLTLGLGVNDRLEGSIASAVIAAASGAAFLRVHDVKAHKRALKMADEIMKYKSGFAKGAF